MSKLHSVLIALIALTLLAVSALAQTSGGGGGGGGGIIPPPRPGCDDRVRSCAEMTDDELWAAAFLDPNRKPHSLLGTCYFHDASSCPTCACPFYVKVSYFPSPSGFDGGTGCLFTRQEVLTALRKLCSEGQCGCPKKNFTGNCIQPLAFGKDPVTGTCCQYSQPCDVPDGWPWFYTMDECKQN
jgi:hypothetical protein